MGEDGVRKTRIALALKADTTADARRAMDAYAGQVDLVELRLDLMREYSLRELLRDRPCPVIVTNRPVWEGGSFSGHEDSRIRILLEAAERGAEHVDCEAAAVARLGAGCFRPSKLIVSKHDFQKTPDLHDAYRSICALQPDVVKVVGMAVSLSDPIHALDVLRRADRPAISLTMGRKGVISRILAGKYGAYLTFVSREAGAGQTAPGQVSAAVLRDTYCIDFLNGDTQVYGYIARTGVITNVELARANAALRAKGVNAVVVPLEIDNESLPALLDACRGLGFVGFAVHPSAAHEILSWAPRSETPAKPGPRTGWVLSAKAQWTARMLDPFSLEEAAHLWTTV